MDMTATILHADLDAFYASVEQLLDPSLRGKPIAVGGGVVLAASYEAKAFGVRGGMPGRRARELCPHLIFVGGHFKDYQRLGDAAIKVLGDFTPLVERISIDEAFADVAGCTHLFGPPAEIAQAVRHRVRSELGLAISVGVARTKHLAKIASQVAKPDGLVVVDPATELDFLHDLPVDLMWGVGPVTRARLAEIGVLTIGQLAKMPGRSLERLIGPAAGEKLTALAWNRDPREIKTHHRSHSAGAQSAIGRKPAEERVFRPTLAHLADRIGARLRAKSLAGRTVTVRVRFADLHAVTRSVTLDARSRRPRALPRSPRSSCGRPSPITRTRSTSRCWRSPCRISRRTRNCSWNFHSASPTRNAAPAPEEAWRVMRPIAPSTRSAIASDGARSDTGRSRWEFTVPFPTSFAHLPKRTCNERPVDVQFLYRVYARHGGSSEHVPLGAVPSRHMPVP
jgi:DNA polymerase-4